MALIRCGGGSGALSNVTALVAITSNVQATLTGVKSGDYVVIMKEDSTQSSSSHAIANTGLTSLGYASIYMGSVYDYLEVFIATADDPTITCNASMGVFKLN